MDATELTRLRRKLLAMREMISDNVGLEVADDGSSDEGGGDLSGNPLDMADIDALYEDDIADEVEQDIIEDQEDELLAIDDALEKIEKGRFGACESCGCAISRSRLESVPQARFCLLCRRVEEE